MDPDAHPPSTMPYTPIAESPRMNSTATGRSVSCNGVRWPNTDTSGPNGMNAKAVNAGIAEMHGAAK